MPVQLGAQLVDDGDRLIQRSLRLGPQLVGRPGSSSRGSSAAARSSKRR